MTADVKENNILANLWKYFSAIVSIPFVFLYTLLSWEAYGLIGIFTLQVIFSIGFRLVA